MATNTGSCSSGWVIWSYRFWPESSWLMNYGTNRTNSHSQRRCPSSRYRIRCGLTSSPFFYSSSATIDSRPLKTCLKPKPVWLFNKPLKTGATAALPPANGVWATICIYLSSDPCRRQRFTQLYGLDSAFTLKLTDTTAVFFITGQIMRTGNVNRRYKF